MNTMWKMRDKYDMKFATCINDLGSLILIFKFDCNQSLVVVGQILPNILKESSLPLDPTSFVLEGANTIQEH